MTDRLIEAFTDAQNNRYELRDKGSWYSVAQVQDRGIPWPVAHPSQACCPLHVGERRYVEKKWKELKAYRARVISRG